MSASTAGKGPGIVLRATNRSGTLRGSVARRRLKGMIEGLDASGQTAEIGLTAEELRALAQALRKVAAALTAESLTDEKTR